MSSTRGKPHVGMVAVFFRYADAAWGVRMFRDADDARAWWRELASDHEDAAWEARWNQEVPLQGDGLAEYMNWIAAEVAVRNVKLLEAARTEARESVTFGEWLAMWWRR